jgi:hypothetical protein
MYVEPAVIFAQPTTSSMLFMFCWSLAIAPAETPWYVPDMSPSILKLPTVVTVEPVGYRMGTGKGHNMYALVVDDAIPIPK